MTLRQGVVEGVDQVSLRISEAGLSCVYFFSWRDLAFIDWHRLVVYELLHDDASGSLVQIKWIPRELSLHTILPHAVLVSKSEAHRWVALNCVFSLGLGAYRLQGRSRLVRSGELA